MKIFEKVATIIFELSGTENIVPEHELQKDIALDSLQMVTLLVMLEEAFNITLDESDMNPFDFTTVEHIIKLVEKYRGGCSGEN